MAELKRSGAPIDADAVARLSLGAFLEYLLGRPPGAEALEALVAASWEWRKEVAVRGEGRPRRQGRGGEGAAGAAAALRGAVGAARGAVGGAAALLRFLMQPFVLSPAINVGDVAVAMKQHPRAAARGGHAAHAPPSPILERFVTRDVITGRGGEVAVRAGTQVIMFTSDFRGSGVQWPVFGAGPEGLRRDAPGAAVPQAPAGRASPAGAVCARAGPPLQRAQQRRQHHHRGGRLLCPDCAPCCPRLWRPLVRESTRLLMKFIQSRQ